MNGFDITVTFKDGKRRKLKSSEKLGTIDGRRKAYFVMKTLKVFIGYSDGEVDEEGDFCVRAANSGLKGFAGIGLPVEQLMGWAYVNTKKR